MNVKFILFLSGRAMVVVLKKYEKSDWENVGVFLGRGQRPHLSAEIKGEKRGVSQGK